MKTTELMRAASRGDYAEAARLLPSSDVGARDQFGNTALSYAAGGGHAEVVRLLLLAGADPSARNDAGSDARSRALSSGREEVVRLLDAVREGGLKSFLTSADRRLLECCREGNAVGVKAELERGANPDARSPGSNWTPLIAACAGGHTDVARLLLARGADTEAQAAGGRRALHFAVELRDIALVRILLDAGADPDPTDFSGVTPRSAARREGSAEVVRLLEERAAAARG